MTEPTSRDLEWARKKADSLSDAFTNTFYWGYPGQEDDAAKALLELIAEERSSLAREVEEEYEKKLPTWDELKHKHYPLRTRRHLREAYLRGREDGLIREKLTKDT